MQFKTITLTSMAVIGAMANIVPSQMGVEVIREDGNTIVREVVSDSTKATRILSNSS